MKIHIAAASLNQTPLAWELNGENIFAAISEAKAIGAALLCLPELAVCGYGAEDMFLSDYIYERSLQTVFELLPETTGIVTAFGVPIRFEGARYNSVCVVADGKILGFVCKQFLAKDGIHYEPRWFEPWPQGKVSEIAISGVRYPIGDLIFSFGAVRLGFEICHDAWVPDRPCKRLQKRGVNIICNPSASHFAFGKYAQVKNLITEAVVGTKLVYVFTNLLGNEAGRAIYDGCSLFAWNGVLQKEAPRFSFVDTSILDAVVPLDPKTTASSDTGVVQSNFRFPEALESTEVDSLPNWMLDTLHQKEEEFTRAVALGLFDYLRKSYSSGFVVSASGGADSTAVACLVALMVRLGVADLSFDWFVAKLSNVNSEGVVDEESLICSLLTCVYQETANSSATTENAAAEVARALGATFLHLDVEPIVQSYVAKVEAALGEQLTWERDDVALQNIQARVRSPGVWLIANLKNALLLATSNRSEAAVGYATMDGDTSGGIAPVAGIDKVFLRSWLRWLEKMGPIELGPIPELSVINNQAPTAELRPQSFKQTDEQDLMPYEVLDFIERLAIRDKRSPAEILPKLTAQYPQYSSEQLLEWEQKFFRLFSQNQWKRERFAPSFHLDDESLDPKTWCRFPILSGGFAAELEALGAAESCETGCRCHTKHT